MDSMLMAKLLLIAHGLLCALVFLRMLGSRRRISRAHLVWAVLVPIAGPLMGLDLIRAANGFGPDLDWMSPGEAEQALRFEEGLQVSEIAPLEEALLVSDIKHRRSLMMSVMRSDPMRYLDLLLIARFNEDTETAHYAASTIMELQRQLQLDIRQYQAASLRDPDDFIKRREYIEQLALYCGSGLLEGQPLYRQRLVLGEALQEALALAEDQDLMILAARNHLALGRPMEAKEMVWRLLESGPAQESVWLEALRIAVETRNPLDTEKLLETMRTAPIEWTAKGREQVSLWMEAKP